MGFFQGQRTKDKEQGIASRFTLIASRYHET